MNFISRTFRGIQSIKSLSVRRTGLVALIRDIKNVYHIFSCKFCRNRKFVRSGRRWEFNIKMKLKLIVREAADVIHLLQDMREVMFSCKILVYIKYCVLIEYNKYPPPKSNCAPPRSDFIIYTYSTHVIFKNYLASGVWLQKVSVFRRTSILLVFTNFPP
jgi:hypothetical protein